MKYFLFLVIFIGVCGCRIGTFFTDIGNVSKDAKKISADFKAMKSTIVPIDTFTMNATSGVLTELANADSREKLDSIAARISRIITQYLNQSFQTLDPGPVGNKLVTGALDTLLAEETEYRIRMLLENVSRQAGKDVSYIINRAFADLASSTNKARLNSLMLSLFATQNSDSLAHFINRSIHQVDYEALGTTIGNDIFRSSLRPEIDSIARTAVRSIFDEIRKDDNVGGVFDDIRNIIILGIGLIGLILAGLFWWNRHKSMQMNKVFFHAIENLEPHTASHFRKSVESVAREKGVLKHVDTMMAKQEIAKREGKKL